MILLGGGNLDTPERQQRALLASPIHYVDAGDPPMLSLHGRQDYSQPLSSRRTCTMLCKKPVCRANCA